MAAVAKNGKAVNRLVSGLRQRSSSASRMSGSSAQSQTPGVLGSGSSTPCLVSGASGKQLFSTSAAARTNNTYSTPSGAIMQRPPRSRPFDVAMSSLTILTGIATGAWIARETAAKLEDLDVFVPDDDDDDD